MNRDILCRSDKVGFRVFNGKAYLTFLDNAPRACDTLYILNESGAKIWELVDGKRTLRGIVKIIQEEFNVEENGVVREVKNFVMQLLRKKLVIVKFGHN